MGTLQKMVRADADRETTVEALGHLMDSQFEIPGLGWRFGLNTIIDLVPGVGDAVTSVIAIVVVLAGVRRRVPRATLLRMALNVAIYAVLGIVPFIGDLFDTWWKPNRRNLALLARARAEPGEAGRQDTAFVVLLLTGLGLVIVASTVAFAVLLHAAWHFLSAPH